MNKNKITLYRAFLIGYENEKELEKYKSLPFVLGIYNSLLQAAWEVRIDVNAETKYYEDLKKYNNINDVVESILEKE